MATMNSIDAQKMDAENKKEINSNNNSAQQNTGQQDKQSPQTDVSTKRLKEKREYDIVLYGATSFVGKLTAAYLQEFSLKQKSNNQEVNNQEASNKTGGGDSNNDSNNQFTWAIAGRNEEKLNKVKKDIGNAELPIIIADSEDKASLDKMTKQARVIISTVGPYLKYGEPLIEACVTNGTDYVDLTGEAIFIKDMMDKYKNQAKQSGARIVNSCGFDSIPSDLGVLFTQNCALEAFDEHCETINMRVKAAKGGLSGGTIASMATIFEEVGADKSRKKQLSNPYLLNDDTDAPKIRQDNISKPEWDAKNERWLAPFVMASINTRIVHRTNQLRDYEYGRNFKYDEAIWMSGDMKGRLMSYGMTAGLAGFAAGMMFKPSRELLNNYILPKSGSGPSESERENGYFDIRFIGYTNKSHEIRTKVTGDKDPGYGSTCRMLAQSALCLAQDITQERTEGGFWTPASAMGEALIKRLGAHSGIAFSKVSR